MTTDPIPWDREFPGTRHYSVGYLSYRLPTIMDVPADQTNVFVDSLEPRWYYGIKSFSETGIGSVPSAISNAVYNATGVRIREHAIGKISSPELRNASTLDGHASGSERAFA
jgi:hypothetical protein